MPPSPDRWVRLWSSISRAKLEREISEEMEFHLEMRAQEYRLQGLSPESARRKAEACFGDVEEIRSTTIRAERQRLRTRRISILTDGIRQDLRLAVRQAWKRPVSSAVAVGILAIGIGVSTAIFNVVYSILLRPMPFDHPERIVQIWESRVETGWERALVAQANFWDLREMTREFEDLGAIWQGFRNLSDGQKTERILAGNVSPGFFGSVLGVEAVLGRTLHPGDEAPKEGRLPLLMGNRFWQSRFGGNPSILGTTLVLDGVPFSVVGILPPGRPWLGAGDVFVAYARDPAAQRTGFDLRVIGRLRAGVTREEGVADLQRLAGRLEDAYPDELAGIGFTVGGEKEWVASPRVRRALWILLGSAVVLFLIACANATTIFLVRAIGRIRETAIRTAAGAGKGRLIRETLTESLLLSLFGSVLGFLLTIVVTKAMRDLDHGQIPGMSLVELDGWILAIAFVVGVGTGVVTGLVPALQISCGDTSQTLRSGGPSALGDHRMQRSRRMLVTSEVALSFLLLVGAGLLGRSLWHLTQVDPGFEVENRLVASISFPRTASPEEKRWALDRFLQKTSALHGIRSVAGSNLPPLSEMPPRLGVSREEDPSPEGKIPTAAWRWVTPGYFRTLGAPLLQGRDFKKEDLTIGEDGRIPIIINRCFGQTLWPGVNPLGRTAILWGTQEDLTGTVVGVVGDMAEDGLDSEPSPSIYFPYWNPGSPILVFHTVRNPPALVPDLRSILAEIDPGLPLTGTTSMGTVVNRSVVSQRSLSILLGLFASVALLLALVGVYGVQAFTVALLIREIGVRMAIGASPGRLLMGTMAQGTRPLAVGILVGLLGAVGLSSLIQDVLFQVGPMDPLTYLGALGLFLLTGLMAVGLAARRVVWVDPVLTFRAE